MSKKEKKNYGKLEFTKCEYRDFLFLEVVNLS